jgi:hypothetical protein
MWHDVEHRATIRTTYPWSTKQSFSSIGDVPTMLTNTIKEHGMTQIIMDRQWRDRLPESTRPTEFVSEQGDVIGYFIPAAITKNGLTNDVLLKLAAAHPPPPEWYEGDEECPF